MHLPQLPPDIVFKVISAISEVATAAVIVWGILKAVPHFRGSGKLSRQLHASEEREREAKDAAGAFRLSSDGWQTAVEAISEQVLELRSEQSSLRSEIASSRAEVQLAREQIRIMKSDQAIALRYIIDLVIHIESGGRPETRPPFPASLQESLNESLRERGGSLSLEGTT
jgi:chromosome segregation ATPase